MNLPQMFNKNFIFSFEIVKQLRKINCSTFIYDIMEIETFPMDLKQCSIIST